MNLWSKIPTKAFYGILLSCSAIIMIASLEVLVKVKDIYFYDLWVMSLPNPEEASLDLYISLRMSLYFTKIIIPMSLGLLTYFTYKKKKLNGLFIFIWTVLSIGNMGYSLLDAAGNSILLWTYLFSHLTLVYFLLSLIPVLKDKTKYVK